MKATLTRIFGMILLISMAACASLGPTASPTITLAGLATTPAPSTLTSTPAPELVASATLVDTATPIPSDTPTPYYSPTPDTRLTAYYWRQWPSVPVISANAIRIYQQGLEMGNDPHAFSKVGDCQSTPPVFFGIYDIAGRYYLGEDYEYLQLTIDHFAGSFGRESIAVKNGMGVNSVLSPLWADAEQCASDESPLACEFRLHNPSIVIVSLGTNWAPNASDTFDKHLRLIVEYSIAEGVLPILATKADNIEGDNKLNEVIAQVAYDYDIPLWNFWVNVQHLPNHGVDPERKGGFIYLLPEAWTIKSFTGLQALDAVLMAVSGQ